MDNICDIHWFAAHCSCFPVQNENDANLTVIFIDGRSVTVPIMVPTSGEAVVMRDGLVLAEDRSMRCYSFPNVSHWYTDSI